MNLFEIDTKDYSLRVDPLAWGLSPFKAIAKRDKTKHKANAIKEMLFVYLYCDIRSDYMYILDDDERITEIKKDIELPEDWVYDKVIKEAVDFYKERSTTLLQELYRSAEKAVGTVRKFLERDDLLNTLDQHGKPVYKPADITRALKDVKTIMQDLKAAEKEVIKEKKETEGRMKGSKKMGMFEEGLKI